MRQVPFPHVILQGIWPSEWLRAIASEFPPYEDSRWRTYPLPNEIGKKAGGREMWGSATAAWFDHIRDQTFTDTMSGLTGIDALVADELGGGMHCTGEGGRLGMHVDFSVHPNLPNMIRRINMLVFLNETWEKEWGGVLYLGAKREIEVLPTFNQTVVFETSSTSWHGHPDPIVGDHLRKSIACYFYAPRRADDELIGTTVWQDA